MRPKNNSCPDATDAVRNALRSYVSSRQSSWVVMAMAGPIER
jgi:hypothetical protein